MQGWHCSADGVRRLQHAIKDFTLNEMEIDELEKMWFRLHVKKRHLETVIASESSQLYMKWNNDESPSGFCPSDGEGLDSLLEAADKDYQTPTVVEASAFECLSAKRSKISTPPKIEEEG